MRSFEHFIADDRYSVPTITFVMAEDEARAREWAERFMRASPHVRGVEVSEGGRRLFGLGCFRDVHRRTG